VPFVFVGPDVFHLERLLEVSIDILGETDPHAALLL
jgi:hypothetical protein